METKSIDLTSQVEKNKNKVKVGDVLHYIDASNFMTWEVTELFEGGFAAKDNYEEQDFFFDELQLGWSFKKNYEKI